MTIDDIVSTSGVNGWDVALAVGTLVATWVAFWLARRLTQAAVDRIGGLSPNVRAVVVRVVKYLVLLTGVAIALTFLGAQLQPLLTVVIVIVAVVALALRGVADNFGAGLVIQTRKPIAIGHVIRSQGYEGVVTELNGRSVLIQTLAGATVHLPNADLVRMPLTNLSESGHRRSEIEARLTSGDDPAVVVRQIQQVTAVVVGVHADPESDVLVIAVEPERLVLRVRFWHDPQASVPVTSAVVIAVGDHLRREGIPAVVTSERPDPPLTPPAPV